MQKSNRDTFNEILEISIQILFGLIWILVFIIFIMLVALCGVLMMHGPIYPMVLNFFM